MTNTPQNEQHQTKPTSHRIRESSLSVPTSEHEENHKQRDQAQVADKLALDIANKMFAEDYYSQHLGIEIVEAKVGYAVCKLVVKQCHSNGHGGCHGGAIFSLADTTFAHICNAYNGVAVGHICTIAYWKPAVIGDELYAYAYESGVYGRSGSYRIEVTCGKHGELVAEFQGFSRSLKAQRHFESK